MPYIYELELIVEQLEIFSTKEDTESLDGNRPQLCVRLQLPGGVQCEVCEKDFGSALAVDGHRTGANCLFVYEPSAEIADGSSRFLVTVHQRCPEGGSKKLGSCEGPAVEMLQDLATANQANQPAQVASQESIRSGERTGNNRPVSYTIKELYPLRATEEGNESEEEATVIGFAVLTIRLSCLGHSINRKVLFAEPSPLHDRPESAVCYMLNADEPLVKCVKLDDRDALRAQLAGPVPSLLSVNAASVTGETEQRQPYDEYAAEMNGNAISIRIEKDANIAISMEGEESDRGCTKGCWTSLTLPGGVYGLKEEYIQQQANGCQLPVIRGTLKYPAHHWSGDFMLAKRTTPVTIEDFRRKPNDADRSRTVGLQACAPEGNCGGVEMFRHPSDDPLVDVFVFKFGKGKRSSVGGRNQIEVELRTPKCPTREFRPKATRGIQVLEDEFAVSEGDQCPANRTGKDKPLVAGEGGDAKGKKAPSKIPAKKGKKK
ncbi:uncharacterized protein LOC125958105 [Anopheles darlingi]|uniref:uncharacterized protein LOC125958105 n=1 Tax=Anopheles darlingi TaxID=43151 RepID=UPI0021001791|nr:uncharacterized protein LOC125958105 [Anopheles darlingi]